MKKRRENLPREGGGKGEEEMREMELRVSLWCLWLLSPLLFFVLSLCHTLERCIVCCGCESRDMDECPCLFVS